MVCGYLPFEDPKTSNLYKKIMAADYQIPKFISQDCADLLTKILTTNPDQRYSIDQIRSHPWFKQVKEKKREEGMFPLKDKMPLDEELFKMMQDEHTFDVDYAAKCIESNRHNQITATYHLIHKRQRRMGMYISEEVARNGGSVDRNTNVISRAGK